MQASSIHITSTLLVCTSEHDQVCVSLWSRYYMTSWRPRNLSSCDLANSALVFIIPVEISSSATFRAHASGRRITHTDLAAMGKRTNFEGDAGSVHANKRQRIEGGHERNSPRPNGAGAEDVHSVRDLQKALHFDQSATADFRNGKHGGPRSVVRLTDIYRLELVQTIPGLGSLRDRRT